MINEIDTKEKVSNKLPFGKQDFKYLIDDKDDKKLNFYAYSFQKWVHIEVLIKILVCILW